MQNLAARFRIFLFILACSLLWLGGCSCRPTKPATNKAPQAQTIEEMEAQRRKRDAEREKKPDFQIIDLQVMPSDEPTRAGSNHRAT